MKLPIVAVLALAACSKSKCEKYGEMEVKCSGRGDSDEARGMALGLEKVCNASDNDNFKQVSEFAKKSAECADKHNGDCAAYKQCTEALRP